MPGELPLFPVMTIGSWPRPEAVLRALRAKRAGRLGRAEFNAIADEAVLAALRCQEEAGVDLVTDGEQRRDNYIAFVADKLENVRMLSLAELLEYIEDKSAFEEILGSLDVPAFSMVNPAAVGPIRRREPLVLDEFRFLRQHTDRAVKVALPGPYLLTRSMWVEGLSEAAYPTKEDLAEDVVRVLREELLELVAAGVDFVQFDEPVLTELVFTRRLESRTFMCGALAARRDAVEELELAVSLVNRITAGLVDPERALGREGARTRVGLHVCRGNWSRQEEVLLAGPYEPLLDSLCRMQVDQLVLEFSTPRAGELSVFARQRPRELGLGAINPRTEEVESPEAVVARAREVLAYFRPEQIFLNPDCGFGTFANRPMNDARTATAKLAALVEGARRLREGARA